MVPRDRHAYVMFNNIPRVGDAERFKMLLATTKPSESDVPAQVVRK